MKDMLRYSIPMIPNTVFWWVTTVSSRYIITAIMGEGANGLYAAAYKWPSAIILISTIFMNAWQMSAISEEKGRAQFFTHVFHGLSSLVFIVGSFLILFSKVITRIMVADSYYESWQYIPLLSVATVYSCMVTFLGTVYVVNKKSTLSLATTAAGAIVNVVLSFFLISYFGINGAAFAICQLFCGVPPPCLRHQTVYPYAHWRVPDYGEHPAAAGPGLCDDLRDPLLDCSGNSSDGGHGAAEPQRPAGGGEEDFPLPEKDFRLNGFDSPRFPGFCRETGDFCICKKLVRNPPPFF